MWRPERVVRERDVLGVAAVDEQEAEQGAPDPRDRRGETDDADHDVFEPGGLDRPPEERQRVHPARLRIDNLAIVMLPAGLVLLRTAMMVDGEQNRARVSRRGTQVHGRLPAIGTDLQQRTDAARAARRGVQRQPFVVRHEAFRLACDLEQAIVHHGRAD